MDFIELLTRNDICGLKKVINTTDDINKAVMLDDGYDLNYVHICAGTDSEIRNEVLKLLFTRKDFDVNTKSGSSYNLWTALHITASWGYVDTLLLLLQYGGNPYITDMNGSNVWEIASEYGNFECIYALESHTNKELSQKVTSLCISEREEDEISEPDVFGIETLVKIESNEQVDSLSSSQETEIYALNGNLESEKGTKIYFDTASNITFVERRHNPKLSIDLNDNVSAFDTWSCSLIESKRCDLGLTPVPVTPTTRLVHAKNVYLLENHLSPSPIKKSLKYSEELHSFMSDSEQNNNKISELEEEFKNNFSHLKSPRNCFTYILLDPRVTNNIQSQSDGVVFNRQLFEKFIKSIFYIGKGQKSRPMQHLFEARKFMGKSCVTQSAKVKRIRDIWSVGRGVVSLNFFHNISSSEALSREFCMLSAIRIENVTNVQRGNNTLRNLKWNDHKKTFFGASLLLKAYYTLLIEGEREIRPADIKK